MRISEIKDDSALLLLIGQCTDMMSKSLLKSKELFAFWKDLYDEASAEENHRRNQKGNG